MTLGKYVNNDTFLHRLDPRNKFILLFVYMVIIFLINPSKVGFELISWVAYGELLVFFIILYKVAKLKFSMVFKSLKAMWVMMIFLLIINLFVYKKSALQFITARLIKFIRVQKLFFSK